MVNALYQELLLKNDFKQLAAKIIEDYLSNNIALFEKDEILRRSRILEAYLGDEYRDLINTQADQPTIDKFFSHVSEFLNQLFPDEDFVIEAVPSENENDVEMPIYKIRSYPSDPTLEVIKTKWDRGDYVIPQFQRSWVWKATQASRLVESFLAGLPVPPIFVYRETKTGKEIIIDGQQRLRTIVGFFDGRLPDNSPFRLQGVSSKWNGRFFSTLAAGDASGFRNSVLRVIVVEQIDPNDVSSMYEIFARLNTGGTTLSAQEVRNASYHGAFNDMVKELNKNAIWRKIFGKPQPDLRMRDVELILRFLSLTEMAYTKPMKSFINNFMGRHKYDTDLQMWIDLFQNTVGRVHHALGTKPFNISRGINASVFDSVMVAFAKCPSEPADLKERYHRLITDKAYNRLIYVSTTDVDTVKARINMAQKVLFEKCQ